MDEYMAYRWRPVDLTLFRRRGLPSCRNGRVRLGRPSSGATLRLCKNSPDLGPAPDSEICLAPHPAGVIRFAPKVYTARAKRREPRAGYARGTTFQMPVFIIQGDEDMQTPAEQAKAYFARIAAPSKRLVLLPGGGHRAIIAMPDQFLAALQTYVRPAVLLH